MKKNKNVYDGAEMVPENVENTHKRKISYRQNIQVDVSCCRRFAYACLHNQYTAELYIS